MSTIDRSTIKMGPGKALYDSANLFSQDGITARVSKTLFEVLTDHAGVVDRRLDDVSVEVNLTPKAWDNLDVILPYATLAIGSSIYGAVDKPLVVTPINGAPITVAAAAVTRLPSLTFSAVKPLLGEIGFTGILANATEWAAAAARLSLGANASGVALTGFDLTKVPNYAYSATLGALTFESEEGFNVEFDLQLEDVKVDSQGVVDKILTSLTATCSFVPVGLTEAQILAALAVQGAGVRRGGSIGGADFVITGSAVGAPIFTLKGASVSQGGYRFARNAKRVGEIQLVTRRTLTNGVLDPLWTVGAVA